MLPPHDVESHRDIGGCLEQAETIKAGEQSQSLLVKALELLPVLLKIDNFRRHSHAELRTRSLYHSGTRR